MDGRSHSENTSLEEAFRYNIIAAVGEAWNGILYNDRIHKIKDKGVGEVTYMYASYGNNTQQHPMLYKYVFYKATAVSTWQKKW